MWGIGLVVLALLGALGHLPLPSGAAAAEPAVVEPAAEESVVVEPSHERAVESSVDVRADNHERVAPVLGVAAANAAQGEPRLDRDEEPRDEPEPAVPAGSGSGKRVVFDITSQHVWLVGSDGTVEREYPVSGSRYDQLDPGSYEVFSVSRHAVSWQYTETMEYMVRFHRGRNANIGFHDIPVTSATGEAVQETSELGTPLSDGCIRQDHDDAKALYEFAPVGTAVVVVRT